MFLFILGCGKSDTVVEVNNTSKDKNTKEIIKEEKQVVKEAPGGDKEAHLIVNNSSSQDWTIFADGKELGKVSAWSHELFELTNKKYAFNIKSAAGGVYLQEHKLSEKLNILNPGMKNMFAVKAIVYSTAPYGGKMPQIKDLPRAC